MRIVIVDDEAFSVQWMAQLIQDMGSGYQVAASFPNGTMALDYLRRYPADVLITDIRMPVMDGLQLLTALRQETIPVYPIIISAYDEFTYAREAMKLGVTEFLLKAEMTGELLRQALERVSFAQARSSREVLQLKEYVENVASGQEPPSPFDPETSMSFLLVTVNRREEREQASAMVPVLLSGCAIVPTAGQAVSDHRLLYAFPYEQGQASALNSAWPSTQAYLMMGGVLTHGQGTDCAQAVRLALQLSQRQQYYQRMTFFDPATPPLPAIPLPADQPKDWMDWLFQRFEEAGDQLADPDSLFCHINRFAAEMFSMYKERAPQAMSLLMDALRPMRTLPMMEEAIREIVSHAKREAHAHRQYSPSVLSAIQYMESHFTQPIGLNQVANHVHLTRSYLSTLFKKEMGMGVIEFLQNHRLETSRALLMQENISVQEAAFAVGIQDPAYFSRIYRDKYGIPPSDTRKSEKTP